MEESISGKWCAWRSTSWRSQHFTRGTKFPILIFASLRFETILTIISHCKKKKKKIHCETHTAIYSEISLKRDETISKDAHLFGSLQDSFKQTSGQYTTSPSGVTHSFLGSQLKRAENYYERLLFLTKLTFQRDSRFFASHQTSVSQSFSISNAF